MRFLLVFTKKSIPEWEQCYYDYINAKSLIIICKKAYAIRCNIEDLAREDNYSIQENTELIQKKQALNLIKVNKIGQIKTVMQQANFLFYKYHSICKRVVFIFLQFKIHQLNERLDNYNKWESYADKTKNLIASLLSNCYAEDLKLQVMTKLHIEAYDKISKKHTKAFKQFGLPTPGQRTARLTRSLQSFDRFNKKLDDSIDKHREIIEQENKFKLEQQVEPSPFKLSMMTYFFGLSNGFSFCIFLAAIILLIINLGPDNPDDESQATKRIIFRNQFRLWKSTAFIILYMWVFAISFYIFQQKRINYNLIFGYKSSGKKSTESLAAATVESLIWCCFFVFYVMDLIGIYPVARVSQNPDYPITVFFPAIIFGLFVIKVLIDFVTTRRGTLFFLLTMSKIILTAFGLFEVAFSVIWATEQLMSLAQVFFDLAYSVCYYSLMLQTPDSQNDPCFSLKIIPEIVIIIAYAIRFVQCIRVCIENGQFVGTREMYRLFRASLYITLAGLSLGSTPGKYNILWFWGFLGVICTIYSFLVDIFLDWNQFDFDNSKRIRRETNIFSLSSINAMMVFNVLARWSFLVTISPNIIFTYVPQPEVIITISCAIELGRRLIWNLLRVENQQIKNNYFFQIRTDYERKEKKIINQISKKDPKLLRKNNLVEKRAFEQLILLRKYINQKEKLKQKVIKFCDDNNKILEDIENSAQAQIFDLVGAIK